MDISKKRRRKIRFEDGKLYGPKLTEKIEEDDFFIDCYKKAAKQVLEILKDDGEKYRIKNRIAFLGDRGHGKTSVMRSFINAIRKKDKILFDDELNGYHIVQLEIVDPSTFEDCSNVLDVILGQMLDQIRNRQNSVDQVQINDLLQKFNNLYTQIQIIKDKNLLNRNNDIYEGAIETLITISDVTNFKENLSSLVNQFLSIMTLQKERNFLIIPIDDIDIDITNCYETVETIRKYLDIPNVIIILAAKLEQLHEGIRIENLKHTREVNIDSKKVYDDIYSMTTKYLLKLLPQNRRIHIPEIINTISSLQYDVDIYTNNEDNDSYLPVGTFFSELIYKKTGILLLNNSQIHNYIINGSLRDIVDLYACLSDMQQPLEEKYTDNTYIYISNLDKFKDYFLNNWCTNNLNYLSARFVRKLYHDGGIFKNLPLIRMLSDCIDDEELKERLSHLFKTRGKKALFYDLSDVSDLLEYIEENRCKIYENNENDIFIYAIKMCYTIIMNQLRLTDDFNYIDKIDFSSRPEPSSLQKFIGGRLLNLKNLPSINEKTNSKNKSVNNIDKKVDCFDTNIKAIDYNNNINDKIEALLLSITSKDKNKDIYFYDYNNTSIKYFYFDSSLFFVNCLDINYTIHFLNDKFFKTVKVENGEGVLNRETLFKEKKALEFVSKTIVCNYGLYDFYLDWMKERYIIKSETSFDLYKFYELTRAWLIQLQRNLNMQNPIYFNDKNEFIQAIEDVVSHLSKLKNCTDSIKKNIKEQIQSKKNLKTKGRK